jgi:hypothetical protein
LHTLAISTVGFVSNSRLQEKRLAEWSDMRTGVP